MQAVQRIFHLREYNGSISFVPAPGFEAHGEPSEQKGEFMGKDICNPSHDESSKIQKCGYQGPRDDSENLNWRKINGPFVSVWLHNVPWGAENTKAAPDAKFSDGYLDLIIIRSCPKCALLSLMTELNNGNHVKSPHVLYLKVSSWY
ncbi:sphingosine kinase 1-like isoform X1 [Camellia sinensis]|uniref:sphingosine kinase 1-like isoform X1 n=1 Tax=Camellia sinensis TaxID=4442 RepID=UPI0010360F8A|nr:sphingosine kinase 1-like isoform X1 [Camellia sinensis]